MWHRKLTRQQKLGRWAAGLWSTPLIMAFPLWIGALYEPDLILAYPDVFLLFFALPFAAAAALYARVASIDRSEKEQDSNRA